MRIHESFFVCGSCEISIVNTRRKQVAVLRSGNVGPIVLNYILVNAYLQFDREEYLEREVDNHYLSKGKALETVI